MIKKAKIEFKRGIACLLATLQIGVISSCNTQDFDTVVISKEEYEKLLDELKTQKMENNGLNLEVEILKDALQAEINKKNEEDKEKEDSNINEDTSTEPIDDPEKPIFDEELANKIGITSEMGENEELKKCLDEFNNYLSLHTYLIYKYENKDGIQKIQFIMNDEVVGEVWTCKETTTSVNFVYNKPEYQYINSLHLGNEDNKVYRTSYDYKWSYEGNEYDIGSSSINYDTTEGSIYNLSLDFNIFDNNTNEDKLFIYLSKNVDGSFTIDLNSKNSLYIPSDSEHTTLNISSEDFQILDKLILSYKEKGKLENILAYCQDTLIEIIKKYDVEEKCEQYINIIKNNSKVKNEEIDKDVSNSNHLTFNQELANIIGLSNEVLENSVVQKNINLLNIYLGNYDNLSYQNKISETSNDITFIDSDNKEVARVILLQSSPSLFITLYGTNYNSIYSVMLDENNEVDYSADGLSWDYNDENYSVGDSYSFYDANYTYTSYIDYVHFGTDSSIDREFSVWLNKDADNNYTLKLNKDVTLTIVVNDFYKQTDLINAYENTNEYGNIFKYCGNEIIEIIQKYDSENICQEFIDIIKEIKGDLDKERSRYKGELK